MKSIKFQLFALGVLFGLFGVGVLTQMYYGQAIQDSVMRRIQEGHDYINVYLDSQKQEMTIISDLDGLITHEKDVAPQALDLKSLNLEVNRWISGVLDWDKRYRQWLEKSGFQNDLREAAESVGDEKKRQAAAYKKAIDLCAEGKAAEAAQLLRVEVNFVPAAQKTIVDLFTMNIRNKLTEARSMTIRFFISTFFAVMLALLVISGVCVYVFRDITGNLKELEKGADAISRGELDRPINLSGPRELSSLAESFNNMQTAIRGRDMQIRRNAEEIHSLNEELKGKLVVSNRKIQDQNEVLVRKNKELEQILYTATHDLRTPLISIQGFAEELKINCDDLKKELERAQPALPARVREILDDELRMSLNYILNGSKRMDSLLDGLLRLSRMGRASVKLEKLDMNKTLGEVVDALSFQIQENKVNITRGDLAPCVGDASMIEQVFFNLISNAIKYRSPERRCEIAVSSEKQADRVIYAIKDNGVGISNENRQRVFDAFYRVEQAKENGEGLGLAIVTRIIDLHNGSAWVDSKVGEGSCFYIQIPNNEA